MMVTARSSAWVPHAVLVTGLVLVLFPVYVAFVGSTLTASDILDAPMTLVPGSHLIENFARALGSGPWRFLIDAVIPLSRTNIAALFVILFIYGWNQYLWPLLVTNSPSMTTIVIGIRQMIGNGDTQDGMADCHGDDLAGGIAAGP